MGVKTLLRQITPPILVSSVRALRRTRRQPVEWEYIPEGWSYAQSHPEVKGWNAQGVLKTYQRKWPRFKQLVAGTGPLGVNHESLLTTRENASYQNITMSYGYALALAAHQRDRITMLDWGGGIGHYYLLAQALLPDTEIEYHCRDAPLLAAYGAQLFPDQHFTSDDRCLLRTYDFILASGSFHFAEVWQPLLQRLVAATDGYLFITNFPVVQRTSAFVFIQRPYWQGYDTEYLAWCLNQAEFLGVADAAGAQLVREFVYAFAPHIRRAPEQCSYRGFLFRCQTPVDKHKNLA